MARSHGAFEGPAAHAPAIVATAFARSPSSPAVFLDGEVFMHCAAAARAPTGAESPQFHIVTDSCVLMRGGAIWCAAARSCDPAPPARKNERFLCTHAPGAPGCPARAARRSVGRFLLCTFLRVVYAPSGRSSPETLKRRSHASLESVSTVLAELYYLTISTSTMTADSNASRMTTCRPSVALTYQ